jgi:hypothetical protein
VIGDADSPLLVYGDVGYATSTTEPDLLGLYSTGRWVLNSSPEELQAHGIDEDERRELLDLAGLDTEDAVDRARYQIELAEILHSAVGKWRCLYCRGDLEAVERFTRVESRDPWFGLPVVDSIWEHTPETRRRLVEMRRGFRRLAAENPQVVTHGEPAPPRRAPKRAQNPPKRPRRQPDADFVPGRTEFSDLPLEFDRLHGLTCKTCGWWCLAHEDQGFGWMGEVTRWRFAYGVLREYDTSGAELPLQLAREYLARNPHKLARYDPFRFEELIADCLRDYYGDSEVVHIGGRRDGGIDIKVLRSPTNTILVQVKRRSDFASSESVRTIRELHGVMLREGEPHGMIVTTARAFSKETTREVARVQSRLRHYSMELMSLCDVIELLRLPVGVMLRPWEQLGVPLGGRKWPCESPWIDRATAEAWAMES